MLTETTRAFECIALEGYHAAAECHLIDTRKYMAIYISFGIDYSTFSVNTPNEIEKKTSSDVFSYYPSIQ